MDSKNSPHGGGVFVLPALSCQKKGKLIMKTIAQPAVITPTIIGLAVLFAAVTFIGFTGKRVPLLSNIRVDIILLVIIGMTMCTQGGIGRIAATGQWSHPQAIIGYILGGLILLITLFTFVGWKLPYIVNDQQALLAIAILVGLKVVNAVIHYLLSRT
jgi:hypothetical protein